MIDVEHLHKRFGAVTAVADVSFRANDGHVTGLLGPNGAGKTTTLRMLYGLVKPDAGKAAIDGVDVLTDPMGVKRKIGVLPDARGLYQRLTARENVRYYAELHGLDHATIVRRTHELEELLGMRDIMDRRVHGFSQGERMKVAIARALVHRPRNVLLDEPTNGLDVMSTRAIRELIRNLRDEGVCVVFSSHVMQEVSALCDSIVVIARGRVAAAGTPDELRTSTGHAELEDAFVSVIGSNEGLQE